MAYPFSVRYLVEDCDKAGVWVLLASPKRYQRFAVNRNRVKRLLRETYRLNKQELCDKASQSRKKVLVSICLVAKTIPSYNLTENRMRKILCTLGEKVG